MSDPLWMREDWKADSLKWRGYVLTGRFAHWCHEWDGLPVDETCDEFQCCVCYPPTPDFLVAQDESRAYELARESLRPAPRPPRES